MLGISADHLLATAAVIVLVVGVTVVLGDFIAGVILSILIAGPIYLFGRNRA